jgi:hypothetical protein
MPLVELAEQLTLIELGMFRYAHLNGRGIGSCAVPLISSISSRSPGQSENGNSSTSIGRELNTRGTLDTL